MRRAGVQVSPHPGECASAAPGGRTDADPYARSGRRWALDAELVYGPIAAELVATSPHPLAGRTVLDAGAGTGAVSAALASQHARAVAIDLSAGMLAWNAAARPPCAVADIRALPFAAASVDDAVAAFVLNHLTDPAAGLAELARVTRPGGTVLAAVFSSASHSEARDRIDAAALAAGWQVPAWYTKASRRAGDLAECKRVVARLRGACSRAPDPICAIRADPLEGLGRPAHRRRPPARAPQDPPAVLAARRVACSAVTAASAATRAVSALV